MAQWLEVPVHTLTEADVLGLVKCATKGYDGVSAADWIAMAAKGTLKLYRVRGLLVGLIVVRPGVVWLELLVGSGSPREARIILGEIKELAKTLGGLRLLCNTSQPNHSRLYKKWGFHHVADVFEVTL